MEQRKRGLGEEEKEARVGGRKMEWNEREKKGISRGTSESKKERGREGKRELGHQSHYILCLIKIGRNGWRSLGLVELTPLALLDSTWAVTFANKKFLSLSLPLTLFPSALFLLVSPAHSRERRSPPRIFLRMPQHTHLIKGENRAIALFCVKMHLISLYFCIPFRRSIQCGIRESSSKQHRGKTS